MHAPFQQHLLHIETAAHTWTRRPVPGGLLRRSRQRRKEKSLCKDFPRWLCFPRWNLYTFLGIMVSVTLSVKCEMIWRCGVVVVDSVGRWEEGASLFMACCSWWWVKMPGEDCRTPRNLKTNVYLSNDTFCHGKWFLNVTLALFDIVHQVCLTHCLLPLRWLHSYTDTWWWNAYVVRERREILVPCSLILEIRLSKLWRDILSMSSAAYLQTLLQTFYPDCAVPLIGKPCRSAPFAAENGWNHSHWFYFVEV